MEWSQSGSCSMATNGTFVNASTHLRDRERAQKHQT